MSRASRNRKVFSVLRGMKYLVLDLVKVEFPDHGSARMGRIHPDVHLPASPKPGGPSRSMHQGSSHPVLPVMTVCEFDDSVVPVEPDLWQTIIKL